LKFQKISEGNLSSYHLFIVLINREVSKFNQKALYEFLKKK